MSNSTIQSIAELAEVYRKDLIAIRKAIIASLDFTKVQDFWEKQKKEDEEHWIAHPEDFLAIKAKRRNGFSL